jgi:hypothetical protein
LQLTAITRPADSTSAQFRMEVDAKFREIRSVTSSGTFSSDLTQVTAGWTKRFVIPGLPGFQDAARAPHSLNASTVIKTRGNRVGGSYDFNYDVLNSKLTQQRIVGYFNSQCCGVSFDWQSVATPFLPVPSDKRFGLSFTLAGIGSFANPLGSFGGR